jgi:hypothetical protein
VAAAWDSASGRQGGGDPEGIWRWQLGGTEEEEISRRSRGGGGPKGVSVARSSRRSGPVGGSAYQETDGCCTAAHSRWLPFIGDEIRDC